MKGRRAGSCKGWMIIGCSIAGAALIGCAPLNPPSVRPGEQPFDDIHSMSYESSDPARHTVQHLPSSAYRRKWFFLAHPTPPLTAFPRDKIHPIVRQWMATRPGTDLVTLMVSYRDTVHIPRFPFAMDTLRRDDPSVGSKADSATQEIAQLDSIRGAAYQADTANFTINYQARVLQSYWLIQATLVEMPLNRVDSLSRNPRVLYIRSNRGSRPPTGHGDTNLQNDPSYARDQIGSEHYYDAPLGLGYGWMALLDTGVRPTHSLMSGPGGRLSAVDCLPPGTCAERSEVINIQTAMSQSLPLPVDRSPEGHGTSSAAIITGNTSFGEEFRGVTRIWLDSFGVYDEDLYVNVDAAVRAFELAVRRLNRVIVAEMQESTIEYADVGAAAERAYQAGAVVIAANGNADNFVAGYPAQGSHVIGVGSYDLQNQSPNVGQASGLTSDVRAKPDLLGPTSSETAGNADIPATTSHPRIPADESLRYAGATSGATPYVAGAASLIRNWMNVGLLTSVDPGQVYSQLILAGDRVGPFVVATGDLLVPHRAASDYGAGMLRLPQTGESRWGKAWVSANVNYTEIPINITASGIVRIDAAIWWPLASELSPNNLDLELVPPSGPSVKSASVGGVFEKVNVTQTSGLTGNWRLRVYPTSVGPDAQTFYWSVAMRTTP